MTIKSETKITLTWSLQPREEQLATATIHIWETTDGLYQVVRMFSSGRDTPVFGAQRRIDGRWDIFEHDHKMGAGYPRYYKSLLDAMESIEILASKKGEVTSNKEEVNSHAHKEGLDGSRRIERLVSSQGEGERSFTRQHKKMSCLDAALQVLEEEDRPMTPKEMIQLMSERGYWSSPKGATPDRTLGAALGKDIKDMEEKSKFKKAGTGLFTRNN